MTVQDYFGAKDTFDTGSGNAVIYRLSALEKHGFNIGRLPFSIRILLEAALRQADGFEITKEAVETIAAWQAESAGKVEIPFKPARVILQDFTGVPSVVDLAALRKQRWTGLDWLTHGLRIDEHHLLSLKRKEPVKLKPVYKHKLAGDFLRALELAVQAGGSPSPAGRSDD